jgi:hypothetical protein
MVKYSKSYLELAVTDVTGLGDKLPEPEPCSGFPMPVVGIYLCYASSPALPGRGTLSQSIAAV